MKRFKWEKQYLYWGVTAFLVIVCSIIFFMSLSRWSRVAEALSTFFRILSPILYGLIIAYLLTPAVKRVEKLLSGVGSRGLVKDRNKSSRLVRAISIVLVLALTLLLVSLLLVMLLPQVYEGMERLITSVPTYVTEAIAFLQRTLDNIPEVETAAVNLLEEASRYFMDWVQNSLLPNVNQVIASVSSGLFSVIRSLLNLFIGVVVSVYIMYNREMFAAQVKKLMYSLMGKKQVRATLSGIKFIDEAFGGFFLGKFVDSAIIGVITFVVLSLLNMPYTALVSVVIGITNMIPFFGPFIGGVPCAIIILLESPIQSLIFVVFIIILQQVDGNILGPKILSNTTGLNGFWVMFSILVGGGLFGFLGMICGVPVFSVIYAGIKYMCTRLLTRKNMPTETMEYAGVSTGAPVEEPPPEDGDAE